ncbi:MAG: hypothetical protein R3D57_13225 [Hyphomicrobiaceae bacterium]
MRLFRSRRVVDAAAETGRQAMLRREGGALTAIASAVALLFSSYSVYETSVRRPDLRLFVPPSIHYASPYQNSNFEVFVVPVTVTNVGARSGAVLALDLVVTNPRTGQSKTFYAAEFGRWTMANAEAGNFTHFAPLAIPGKSSVTDSVIFYSRLDETVMQIADGGKGAYDFKLAAAVAEPEDLGPIDRLWAGPPAPLTFQMIMPAIDHRVFQTGTLMLYQADWKPSGGAASAEP